MNYPTSDEDQQLLARLGGIARSIDPVPPLVADLARAAFAFRDFDAELAALVNDSTRELTAVRGPELDERLLEFASTDTDIALQVSSTGRKRSMLGQIRTARTEGDISVVAESTSGDVSRPATVDPHGRFSFDALPSGFLRLRCIRTNTSALLTPWFDPAS